MSLLAKVKSRLFIHANRRALGLLEGEYGSLFRGCSMDFDDLRGYVAGDEVKDIDWKATARFGSPLIKRYIDTRRQDVLLLVDTGRNMSAVAASGESKRSIAVLVAGVLGYLSIRHGDVVGLASGGVDSVQMMRRGGTEGHLERILQRINGEAVREAAESDLGAVLEFAGCGLRRRQILVVIADDLPFDERIRAAARNLAAQHELLWMSIADADLTLVGAGRRAVVDVRDGASIPGFARSRTGLAAEFRAAEQERIAESQRFLAGLGVSHERLDSLDGVVPALLSLLRRRRRAGI